MQHHRFPTFFSGKEIGDDERKEKEGTSRVIIKQEKLESLFTTAQLHELQYQILILNHIQSGHPLSFPAWSWGSKSGVNHHFSCFLGLSYKGYSSRNMTDPEPDRCRRTDGKKWRCYKSVVKDQKYCERHMHRGRQRSRKLVEGLETAPKSSLAIADTNTLISASTNTCRTVELSDAEKASIPTNSQPAPPTSGSGKTTPTIVNVSSISRKKVKVNSHPSSAFPELIDSEYCKCKGSHDCGVDVYNPSSCYRTSASVKAAIARRDLHVDEKGLGSYNFNEVRVISSNHHFKEDFSCPATPANGFSRNSLLQYSQDENRRYPSQDHKNGSEAEPMRCKRTDGKLWRCSREVVHGKKYCEKHMHRGKKVTEIRNPPILATDEKVTEIRNPPILATATASASASSEGSDNPFFIAKRSNSRINLNMDPAPPIVARAMTFNGVNQSTSSASSSDATTISD